MYITQNTLDCLNAGNPAPIPKKNDREKVAILPGPGFKYRITPVSKPRMTQSDKWRTPKRPCVEKYHNFKDQVRDLGIEIPKGGTHITFNVPMAKSWPKKEKLKMFGRPHQQRPDVDNFLKAILDAVYIEDSGVWDIRVSKRWAYDGSIVIQGLEK